MDSVKARRPFLLPYRRYSLLALSSRACEITYTPFDPSASYLLPLTAVVIHLPLFRTRYLTGSSKCGELGAQRALAAKQRTDVGVRSQFRAIFALPKSSSSLPQNARPELEARFQPSQIGEC